MGMIQISGHEYQVGDGMTIQQAVSGLGFHPDSFLFLIDGKPVPMDTVITDSMTVRAMKVASGG